MAELQKLKARALANGNIGDAEVRFICRELYADCRIDKEVVELLIAIRDEALSVCLMFEQFLFDAVKHHVLTDGAIDAEEAFWLRQRLFANGNLGKREKKLLWDLKHEVLGVSREFQQLYDEYM